MGTVNGTLVSNFEAAGTLSSPQLLHGRVRVAQGSIALSTGDLDASDIVHLAPIPSNAAILSIKVASDDLDSNGTPTLAWNIGVYTSAGVVKDADAFASAVTLGQAATAFTEYAFEARDISETGQKLYQDATDTSDPGGFYYVSLTASTGAATAAAGDIAFIIEYVVD